MPSNKKIIAIIALVLLISSIIGTVSTALAQETGPVFMEEMVQMRDGVKLYTRIYLPDRNVFSPPYPAILTRTPYGIGKPTWLGGVKPDPTNSSQWPAEVFHGYARVFQDTRGRYYSEGVDRLFYDDGADGYDTVEWVAAQSWCNGKVGMMGASAMGITTYLAAGEKPPHLAACISYVASANLYNEITFEGGAFRMDSMIWTYMQTVQGLSNSHLLTVVPSSQWPNISLHIYKTYLSLMDLATHTSIISPYRAVDSATWMKLPLIGGNPSYSILQPFGDEILRHPSQDAFREKLNVLDTIDVPILHVGGWYDFFGRSTISAFTTLQDKGNQKLFMAPGNHTSLGYLPYDAEYAWFDYWLKGVDTGIMDEPPVGYYCLGANEWRWADTWPIGGIKYTNYYLHSDGTLSTVPCGCGEEPESYIYDPMNPVLTWGGRNLGLPAGSMNQNLVEAGRSDVLTYKSDVLAEDVEVAGPVKAILSASSNCTDTDFTAKLIDVYPDGRAMLVVDGILRARYRESMAEPELMEPGQIYELTIDLGDTSYVFKAGHRIQVSVSSSNFPKYDRNLNSGGTLYSETEKDILIAENTVYHDKENPSYIVLPIVPPKPKVFEGNACVNAPELTYEGPAELHVYEKAVYLHFDSTWIKWKITCQLQIKPLNIKLYYCEGKLGKLSVVVYAGKPTSYAVAIGNKVFFCGNATYN